jgi:proline dehydrogenase
MERHSKLLFPLLNNVSVRCATVSAAAVKDVTHAQSPKRDPLDISFANPEAAFKSKTTWEVLRALIVYQMCSIQYLVDNNMKVTCTLNFILFLPITTVTGPVDIVPERIRGLIAM